MIIDLILDRKDNIKYDNVDDYEPERFYSDLIKYDSIFKGIANDILCAMDYGTEQDVQNAICDYIVNNEYNKNICDFVRSVKWLEYGKGCLNV